MERNKTLTAEVEKEMVVAGQTRSGLGRVRFLARLEPIRTAVAQGYPLRMIYEAQREGLGISYYQFTRYVKQFVHASGEAIPNGQNKRRTSTPRGRNQQLAAKAAASTPRGFRYRATKGDDDLV